ncbi:MAG: hypothetical protein ABI876_07205 [Bacteroidota bacterium]
MAIECTTGDLFAMPELTAMAHGCTCAAAIGKGIAVEFKRRWPTMYSEYRHRCHSGTDAGQRVRLG